MMLVKRNEVNKMARDLTRVTVNLASDLVAQIDKYAEDMSLTRTSACAVLISQSIKGNQAMSDLQKLIQAYEDEKAKGKEC